MLLFIRFLLVGRKKKEGLLPNTPTYMAGVHYPIFPIEPQQPAAAGRGAALAAAACLPVGGRLRLRQPRRTGAQGAQCRDAGELLDRSADVPGRQ